jgi:hypothetical protein
MNPVARTSLALVLALGLAGTFSTAFGQSKDGAAASDASNKTVSIRFEGGSLADYVAAVQEAAGWVNVVVDPRASEVKVLPCELRHVSVPSALEAAGAMIRHGSGEVSMAVDAILQQWGWPVYAVRLHFASRRANEPPPFDPIHHSVFSIREILSPPAGAAGLKAEAVLTAIDTAVGLAAAESRAVIKYHADTGLVIVQGTVDQVRLVDEVISRIRDDARMGRAPAEKSRAAGEKKSAGTIEERIAVAERELDELRKELARKNVETVK